MRVVGNPIANKKLTKELKLSGKKGYVYMVNAWGKGTPLPETSNDKARRFGVEVVFVAADNSTDVHYTNFSPDILDWQFLSDVYVAKKDYVNVKISYCYCRNANMAYFDGLSLFCENYGQTYSYDSKGNLISAVDAQKNARKFEYNSSTQDLTGVTDAKGNSFKYEYDSKHNVKKATSAAKVVYSLTYDDAGNVIKSGRLFPSSPEVGTWMERTFDAKKNHVLSVTNARGMKTQYVWDDQRDLLTSMTDPKGSQYRYTYDKLGRLLSTAQNVTVNGSLKEVKNTYLYSGGRLTAIGHNGFQYGFGYDAFGNLTGVSASGNKLIGYEYEAGNGNLKRTVYGNGDYLRCEYDSQDRLVVTYSYRAAEKKEAKLYEYVYDKQGNVCRTVAYNSGKKYALSYDFLDRLSRVVDEGGNVCEYTYDAEHNLTRLYHSAGSIYTAADYTYDKDGKEATARAGQVTRTAGYDAVGRVISYTWDTAVPYKVEYGYVRTGNGCSCLPRVIINNGRRMEYTYDANGNIASIQEPAITTGNNKSTFQYDERNQLIRENNHVVGETITYQYDIGGNLVSVKHYAYTTGTLPSTPKRTETGKYSDTFKDKLIEWNNGGTVSALTYDGTGNLLKKGNVSYIWNEGRELSGVENGKSIRYYYDHTGMRTKKTVSGVTTEYRYGGSLLLSEKTGGETIWYYYDSKANPLGFMYQSKKYLYIRNAQNDIIGVIDAAGNTVVNYSYDSWGKLISITGSLKDTVGKKNPFRYRGYYFDGETGLYYLQSRYYDPEIRRFISADDISVTNVSPKALANKNLYSYCDNNPIVRKDSIGKFWDTVFDLLSFGFSVAEVIANPYDVGAWIGLAGDTIDLIPFVTGVGETVKALRFVDKAGNTFEIAEAVDFTKDAEKIVKSLERTDGVMKSTAALGTEIHRGYKFGDGFSDYYKEYGDVKGIRPDYYNESTGIIYELKPRNMRAAKAGVKQLRKYNRMLGGKNVMRMELY